MSQPNTPTKAKVTRKTVGLHFSAHSACTITFAHLHACAHTRMAQVSVKRCLHMCRFSPSRLPPSHDSPILAVPWRSLRDHSRQRPHWRSRPHDLAVLSRPKSAGHAPHPTCIAKFGYLTKSDANTFSSIQETSPWDVPDLALPGYVCYGSKIWAHHVFGFGSVLQNWEIVEVRREMHSGSLWNHSGDGRSRSGLRERPGDVWSIHLECH